jgi:hypothetical protein
MVNDIQHRSVLPVTHHSQHRIVDLELSSQEQCIVLRLVVLPAMCMQLTPLLCSSAGYRLQHAPPVPA